MQTMLLIKTYFGVITWNLLFNLLKGPSFIDPQFNFELALIFYHFTTVAERKNSRKNQGIAGTGS